MDLASEAARLREAAEAKPLRLPVRRRVDETHRSVTPDGLTVWFTIQVSSHARIHDAVFEREDRMPSDAEVSEWLRLLIPGREAVEAPSLPGARTRHFEAFERDSAQAPSA
jgi:hypothetical protein